MSFFTLLEKLSKENHYWTRAEHLYPLLCAQGTTTAAVVVVVVVVFVVVVVVIINIIGAFVKTEERERERERERDILDTFDIIIIIHLFINHKKMA